MGNSFNNINKQSAEPKPVELVFPKYEQQENDEYVSKGGLREGLVKVLSTSMNAITEWFNQYQVESIELWISGMMQSEGIIKLVVSAKGEGGLKVVLKPRPS